MNLPAAAISLSSTNVNVSSSEDAMIALSSVTFNSSPPSLLGYSENIGHTAASVENAGGDAGRGTDTAPEAKSKTLKSREYIQLATLCWFVYLEGWNDGTNGPLLPRIQRVYNIGYMVVSLMFVFACLGFIAGALSNIFLTERLGFGKVMVLGSLFQVVAYCIDCAAPPFPVFLFAYFINGVGLAWQNAQSVAYVASLKENPETKMGILMAGNLWYFSANTFTHVVDGFQGAGGLSAPLVATQFSKMEHWSFHYLVSLALALVNTVTLIAVFRFKRQEECLAQIGIPSEPKQTGNHSHFRQIMTLKDVHILAFFILLYVGAEVTIGGWIITYIIDVRGGGASSGYISTGFFAGMMIGRVALLWLNQKIGEHTALLVYAVCAIGLEFIVWFVPSLVGDAVTVAIIGVLMGPMYPIAMNHGGRVLPRRLQTGALGFIAGSGQAGSALVPFMAGAIASKAGIAALQPVLVGILGFMTVIWILIARKAWPIDKHN